MEYEKIREIVHAEWKKDKTVHIPRDSQRILQGTELMKAAMKQKFIDEFTEAVNKKPKDRGFTRGMFGLDEKQILGIIESM